MSSVRGQHLTSKCSENSNIVAKGKQEAGRLPKRGGCSPYVLKIYRWCFNRKRLDNGSTSSQLNSPAVVVKADRSSLTLVEVQLHLPALAYSVFGRGLADLGGYAFFVKANLRPRCRGGPVAVAIARCVAQEVGTLKQKYPVGSPVCINAASAV